MDLNTVRLFFLFIYFGWDAFKESSRGRLSLASWVGLQPVADNARWMWKWKGHSEARI